MSGDDRRVPFLGRLEKSRELIASLFGTFTRDFAHKARMNADCTAPYSLRQPAHASGTRARKGWQWPEPGLLWLGLVAGCSVDQLSRA